MTSVHTAPINTLTPRTRSTSMNNWTINLVGSQVQAAATKASELDNIVPQRWYPKLTPYRLATMIVTIVLGSLKALYAYKGQTSLSTTLEWIIGVVVFLTIYILGLYEELHDDEDDTTTSFRSPLKWFFCYDCLDIIWQILPLVSVEKPSYQSRNRKIDVRHYDRHPPVTGYRLLVSFVTLVFGVAKMICGYIGLNDGVNSLDWSFGVVITSILYILGLYELNNANVLDILFRKDFSWVTRSISTFMVITAGLFLGISWTFYWVFTAVEYVKKPFSLETTATDPSVRLIETSIDVIHDLSLKVMMTISILGFGSLIGIVVLAIMVYIVIPSYFPDASFSFSSPFLGSVRRFILGKIYKRILSWTPDTRSIIPEGVISRVENFFHYATEIFVHSILHGLGFAGVMLLAFVMFGFSFRLGISFAVLPGDGVFEIIMCYLSVLILFVTGVLALYLLIPLTQSFLEPLRWFVVKDYPRLQKSLNFL